MKYQLAKHFFTAYCDWLFDNGTISVVVVVVFALILAIEFVCGVAGWLPAKKFVSATTGGVSAQYFYLSIAASVLTVVVVVGFGCGRLVGQ